MIGVCIGVGGRWGRLAAASARRMQEMTGVPCVVMEDAGEWRACHPSWLKSHIHRLFTQENEFLVFDADLLALRPWDPAGMFEAMGRPFMAVPEPNANPVLLEECREWGLGFPDVYINAGLLLYGREHGYVWDRVWAMHPRGGRWLEQTALNHALAMEAVEMCRLPRRFNVLAQMGRLNSIYCRATLGNAVNVHTCGMSDPDEIFEHHRKLLAYVESGRAGRTRQDLLRLLPVHSTGAEIGVFCGDFSKEICNALRPRKLYLVDLFEGRVTSGNVNGQNMRTVDMARVRRDIEALRASAVQTVAEDSIRWLASQPNASLDWVYIDTAHDYHGTCEELRHARRVVRPGGWICGHDFSRAFPGVVQAVIEFCARHQLRAEIFDGDLLPSYAVKNTW